MKILGDRVRRIHIGTHGRFIHRELRRFFLEYQFLLEEENLEEKGKEKKYQNLWAIEQDVPNLTMTETPVGPVVYRDGMLTLRNRKLLY